MKLSMIEPLDRKSPIIPKRETLTIAVFRNVWSSIHLRALPRW